MPSFLHAFRFHYWLSEFSSFSFAKETLENRELVSKLSAELVGREIQSRLEIARTVVESAANKLAADGVKRSGVVEQLFKRFGC